MGNGRRADGDALAVSWSGSTRISANSTPERDPLRVVAEQDDLFGAEPFAGDHAAEADRAVADDGDRGAGRDPCRDGGVVAGAHHVRQRR